MTAIGCFGKGRGIAWRLVEQEIVDARLRTVRVGIETVEIGERDVSARQEACYFALDAMPTNGTVMSLPAPSGGVDPRSGLRLPYQLGWLQFDGSTDNEPAHPGLGWSVAYGGLGIQATVYVYDQGKPIEPDDLESERVQGEFRTAVQGVLGVNPGARSGRSSTPCTARRERCRRLTTCPLPRVLRIDTAAGNAGGAQR